VVLRLARNCVRRRPAQPRRHFPRPAADGCLDQHDFGL